MAAKKMGKGIVWQKENTPKELHPVLRALAEEYPLLEASKNATVLFERISEPGVCRIVMEGKVAKILYSIPSQAIRALGTVLAGLGSVEEVSPFTTFGIMLDCSRNAVMKVEHFKKWLRRLALLGYNMAMLYTEDTYEIPGEPFFGFMRGRYTAAELKAIDDYAYSLGIEMIPCIQTLGHLAQILQWPAYREVMDTSNVILVDEDKTYELIRKMLLVWKKAFRSRRVHIGMDETHDLGRGQFYDRFGHERHFDIFNRHLAKVTDLCLAEGLKPMIWSDMYFRLGSKTNAYYDKECVIPADVKKKIHPDCELVYWDYYHWDKEFYLDWIQRHRDLHGEPLMGSGVWTWGSFWHDRFRTEGCGGSCVEACREAGVKELFFTMWGDDGAFCDVDSSLAGLAWVAEKAFAGTVDKKRLSKRFAAVCHADYEAVTLAADMLKPTSSRSLMWDDPLQAIFLRATDTLKHMIKEKAGDSDSLPEMAKTYQALAKKLKPFAKEKAAGNLKHAILLCEVFGGKTALVAELAESYGKKNKAGLKKVAEEIPALIRNIEKLLASFRVLWMERNKPQGFEVLQIRFAAQMIRLREIKTRIGEYLSGAVDSIPELEESARDGKHFAKGSSWHALASGSSSV
jgi:hypothetical protein